MESRTRRVLRERAQKLAGRDAGSVGADLEVVSFCLADERYALASRHVGEAFPLRGLTPLPCTPPFVAGVVNLRGQILSLVDLKVFFDLPPRKDDGDLMVILIRSETMEMGLLVDPPLEVRRLPLAAIHPPLATLTGVRSAYLHGLAERDLIVLDGRKILEDPSLRVMDEL